MVEVLLDVAGFCEDVVEALLDVAGFCEDVVEVLLDVAGLEGFCVVPLSISTLAETLPQASLSSLSSDAVCEVALEVLPEVLPGASTLELVPSKSTSFFFLPQAAKNVNISAITAIIAIIFFKIIAPLVFYIPILLQIYQNVKKKI